MAKCSYEKCISGKPAKFMPVLLLWPERGTASQPAHVNLNNVVVCVDCSKKLKPHNYFNSLDEWIKIVNYFKYNKKSAPSLRTAKVTYMVPETKVKEGMVR